MSSFQYPDAVYFNRLIPYLVSDRGPDGLTEELHTEGWQEADAHSQNDGEPQVRLAKCISGNACGEWGGKALFI